MREAMGGIFSLVILAVFLILIMMFLAFGINYTKAFKVKNYIVSKFEENEGRCLSGSKCDTQIQTYIKEIGYSADTSMSSSNDIIKNKVLACNILYTEGAKKIKCSDSVVCNSGYYCYRYVEYDDTNPKQYYYIVTTKVNIKFLMMSSGKLDLFGIFDSFYVTGETKVITNTINRTKNQTQTTG